jgi:hypothetical protein
VLAFCGGPEGPCGDFTHPVGPRLPLVVGKIAKFGPNWQDWRSRRRFESV